MAANATTALRPVADAHQDELVTSLGPAVLRGDRTRLGRIVTNLLTDAIRFTATGGTIPLDVHVERA